MLIYHTTCRMSTTFHQKEEKEMAKENEAIEIIAEGTNVEVQTESFGCCWTALIMIWGL